MIEPPDPFDCCLECGYSRVGLAPEQLCPECGKAPPPADSIVLSGSTVPGRPRVQAIVRGLTALPMFAIALFCLRGDILFGALMFGAPALALAAGAVQRWRVRHRTGDLVWVITRDACIIRSFPAGGKVLPLRAVARCRLDGSLLGRWRRIQMIPTFFSNPLTNSHTREIWCLRRKSEMQAMCEAIQQRIRAARE